MRSTIKTVTKNLKPKVRNEIRLLFKMAEVMDLYTGMGLDTYLTVIRQRFFEEKRERQRLERKIEAIRRIV